MTQTNNFKVVGIIGKLNSGKDTLADEFAAKWFLKRSFADPLKSIIHEMFDIPCDVLWGPSEKRTGEVRQMLQEIGTDFGRKFRPNVWVDKMAQFIKMTNKKDYAGIVIPDIRFTNEAKLVYDLKGVLIQIIRPGDADHATETMHQHASETGVASIPKEWITHTVQNDGSLNDLLKVSQELVKEILA